MPKTSSLKVIEPQKGEPQSIGTINETSLHASLKAWYASPGDQFEMRVGGFIVDILRGDSIIEIQTGNFSSLKSKLSQLLQNYPVILIHPIPQEKWIIRIDESQIKISRRKSPKRGSPEHLFFELVRMPELVKNPNFKLEVLLTREEEVWRRVGRGSWRRKGWSIVDRSLIDVVDQVSLSRPDDYLRFLPASLPPTFTTRDLSSAIGKPSYLTQKIVYCLHAIGLIERVGKQGRSWVYSSGHYEV
jgi:hypothetical protein